jgi:hypothetical protein
VRIARKALGGFPMDLQKSIRGLKMSSKVQNRVRIVKRRERHLIQTRPATLQTPAQVRREMVSTIVSWIDDRKRSQQSPRRSRVVPRETDSVQGLP